MKKATILKLRKCFAERRLEDNRWDTLPETYLTPGYVVRITATGNYYWDNLSEKGCSRLRVEENECFKGLQFSSAVDDYILKKGVMLEDRGFDVVIKEEIDPFRRMNLYTKRRWFDDRPPEEVLRLIRVYELKAGIDDLF